MIPTLYSLSGRYRLSFGTLGLHVLGAAIYGALTCVTFTLFELSLREGARGFVESYLELLPGRLAYGTIVYGFVYGMSRAVHYYHEGQQRKIDNARLEKQLTEARLQALRNQLRPHFLFNTLHAISTLMGSDVKETRRMMALLGELLRISLEQDEQEVPLEQELQVLDLYLSIEQIRFQDRLRVEKDVAADTLQALVPHFVLQPIVENAIRHGIGTLSSAGTVEIRAQTENGSLQLSVLDDGPGSAGPVDGVGLANLRARLAELYGDACALELASTGGRGFRATVTIPFRRPD